jgi:hypothetical protein
MGFSALATSYLGGYYRLKHTKGQQAARHHGEKRKLGQLMRQGWGKGRYRKRELTHISISV